MERNQPLVRLGIEWQQNGVILPDTYLLDYDTILENARSIKQAGDANGVQNFFMLKQIGRNPLIARALTDMGYVGAVCVDFREALTMVFITTKNILYNKNLSLPKRRSIFNNTFNPIKTINMRLNLPRKRSVSHQPLSVKRI